ncbi:uncharacterized protein JN550_003689 [Neoarthrinium moseri]|uniref:uncharacterized protein n=1 Tax=Neoarthrinium moseri TaxID=1658444 RepID=UPI001FDDC8F2|nr:uncharacterized protein JN550_003689 [Neoarthrinium moseri]KAI1872815.1 hypothetical protein JN550_003689 [Neoarthrinium moseri]
MATATALSTGASSSTHTRSNLGPLTTTFVAPSYCNNIIAGDALSGYGWQAQSCRGTVVRDDTSCWPTTTPGAPASSTILAGWGFYSPGIVCPSNYVTACSKSIGQDGGFDFQFGLISSETAIGCCPTGYQCSFDSGGRIQTCINKVSSTSILTGTCLSDSSVNYAFKTLPFVALSPTSSGDPASTTTIASYVMFAPLFQLVHKPEDLPATATGVTSAAPTSSGNATTDPSPSSSPGSGLSSGAAAGIGVGAAAAVIIICILAYFLWRSRKRRQTPELDSTAPAPMAQYGQPTQGGYAQSAGHTPVYSELSPQDGVKPQELGSHYVPVELSGNDVHFGHSPATDYRSHSEMAAYPGHRQ